MDCNTNLPLFLNDLDNQVSRLRHVLPYPSRVFLHYTGVNSEFVSLPVALYTSWILSPFESSSSVCPWHLDFAWYMIGTHSMLNGLNNCLCLGCIFVLQNLFLLWKHNTHLTSAQDFTIPFMS